MPSSIKLKVGQALGAWRDYPETKRRLSRIPVGPSLLVTGAHRSGTTWFGSMLAASGIWNVHEPFAPYRGLWDEWFTYADRNSDRPDIDALMARVLKGKIFSMGWSGAWYMPLRLLPQSINRVLIKDPIASLMSEYLTCRFKLQTLVLFRHPGAFAESVLRLGWSQKNGLRQFLANEPLMEEWLAPHARLIEQFSERDSLETIATMHGCLNTVLYGFVKRNKSMTPVFFEEVCQGPNAWFEKAFRQLNLPYDVVVSKTHHDLCSDEKSEERYHAHSIRRDSRAMIDGWRARLPEKQVAVVRKIWETFDFPFYRDESDWEQG